MMTGIDPTATSDKKKRKKKKGGAVKGKKGKGKPVTKLKK